MDAALVTAEPSISSGGRTGLAAEITNLREIYVEYFHGVWRNLRRLGVPDAVLDDAVQDVFLVVHRRYAEFARRSSLKTWIFGIVLHVAKDYRRATRRHAARTERYAQSVDNVSYGDDPAELAERREAVRLLHTILEKLGYEERAVFVLVELEELSLREAAAACSLSLATCQRRLQNARIAFDAALKRHNDQPRWRRSP
jgi:RNA polymerase sigma-70 factor (ECF subfamily)